MDTLAFKIREDDRVDIYINGKNLSLILREYEMPFCRTEGRDSLAGAYGGLYRDILITNLRSREKRVNILGCECGEEECWPMKIQISEKDNQIIWSHFEQVYKKKEGENPWNYDDFGPYVFDKVDYEGELKRLQP